MNKITEKEQCPACAEEGLDTHYDNLVTFADTGVKHCFRHGVIASMQAIPIEGFQMKENSQNISNKLEDGIYSDIPSRKLKKSVCEFYGYMINREKQLHIANYYDDAGNVVFQQLRTPDKQFPVKGNRNYQNELWGMSKFTPNPNLFITITEGQIDALSIAQVFDCKYPVVSLPNGCANAANVIRENMHKLKGFKYVVLAFDADKPGIQATEACIKEFEPGGVRVARWRRKDANEHLIAGEEADIRKIVYDAVAYMPAPVLSGDSLMQCLDGYKYTTDPWPWSTMNTLFNPIKIPSVISVVAKPKRGKTEFMAAISRFKIGNGGNIAIISLEQSPAETFLKQVMGQTGKFLSIENRELTDEEKSTCLPYKNRIVIYDHVNHGQAIPDIIKNIPYMVKALNCDYVILDNLTSAGASTTGDDRKSFDKAMSDLKALTVKYNFTLFNVMHLKRNDSQIMSDEEEQPNVEQIRGTQGIEAFSDCVIGLHRNVKSNNSQEKNTLYVTVLADRMPGNRTGNQIKLIYNEKTGFLND